MSGAGEDTTRAIAAGLAALQLDPALAAPLLRYLALLDEWNAIHNLTAIRDPRQQVTKHLLDSLSVLPWVPERGRLLDVGAGAGLPGIPLALARPGLEVTLLDSRNKKVRFCEAAIAALGLAPRVRAVHSRCESFHGPRFDAIISRAFGSLAEFVALTAHLGDGGPEGSTRWLAMKGSRPEVELAELAAGPKGKAARFRVEAVHPIAVPGLEAARCLVVLRRG